MSEGNNVEVKFGAETSGLKSGMEGAAGTVEGAINRMNGAFAGLANALQGHTSAVTAATCAIDTAGSVFPPMNWSFMSLAVPMISGLSTTM